ncbi:hypothetical protein GGQ15_002956 [Salinibacter ruber]|nr:hypothetical protein [Salinibacter ruber]
MRKSAKVGENINQTIDKSFVFCFVRNPYDWVKSFYKYQEQKNWVNWKGPSSWMGSWHPTSKLNQAEAETFESFLQIITHEHSEFITRMYGNYTRRADFVGKTEYLVEHLVHVLQKREIRFDESKIRKKVPSNTTSNRSVFASEKTIRAFCDTEKKAFEDYGYDIENTIRRVISDKSVVDE